MRTNRYGGEPILVAGTNYFGCFSVVVVAIATSTDERELQCWQQYDSISSNRNATSELCSGWWAVWPDINSVTGGDTETGCYGKMCSTRENTVLAKREC